MFPFRLNCLRSDGTRNLDMKIERLFPIHQEQGIQARFSIDLLNTTNDTNFSGPNTDRGERQLRSRYERAWSAPRNPVQPSGQKSNPNPAPREGHTLQGFPVESSRL